MSRDPSISNALSQVATVMFDRPQRKKKRHHHYHYQQQQQSEEYLKPYPSNQYQEEEYDENQQYRKCSNSLCQMIENDVGYPEF
jgi:hypothetical protein